MNHEPLTQPIACSPLIPTEDAPELVGNKAANLIRMARAELPVPPGFVITTTMCREYFERGEKLREDFSSLLAENIQHIEAATGLTLGGQRRPLLVSVRSGAPVSMPGMMDTILNVGLCDRTVSPLIRMTGNPRFVWDSYRRLIQAYAAVVHSVSPDPFEHLLNQRLQQESVCASTELDAFTLRALTQEFLQLYARQAGAAFPQDPLVQLTAAAEAVFRSWRSPRAIQYRRLHHIDEKLGTAVTVQAMAFGNMGSTSGSGVAFTRDPTTGEPELYLDFLWNAQGEDVVSGRKSVQGGSTIRRILPAIDRQLQQISSDLERLFGDVQDFEFTIQEGQLYLLQSRAAKCTPWAALRIACDLVDEQLIEEAVALQRLSEYDLDSVQVVRIAPDQTITPLSSGVPACPGVAVGQIVFDPQAAVQLARDGLKPILVRHDISTDDVAGMAAAEGILTMLGGRTSHAAVVARQMNKVCIVGCRDLIIERNHRCCLGETWLTEGEVLSLDGHSGKVYAGELDIITQRPEAYLAKVQQWKQHLNFTPQATSFP